MEEIVSLYKKIFKEFGLKKSTFDSKRSKGRVFRYNTPGYIIDSLDYKNLTFHIVDVDLFEKIKNTLEKEGIVIERSNFYGAGMDDKGTLSGTIRIK